jgi:hypothetical protein
VDISRLSQTAQWVSIETKYGEFDALIEPFGNAAFRKLHDKLMQPHQKAQRKGTLSASVEDAILIKCLSETIWVGWRGITNGTKPVEYSAEKAAEYLANPIVRNAISKAAMQLSDSTVVELEDSAGN